MPSIANTRRYNNTFVNVRVRTDEEIGSECGVCFYNWCEDDMCGKSIVQTSCCFQGLCASCVTKMSMRCKCTDDCDQVVFICPYCKTLSRADSRSIFLGHKKPCKKCRDNVSTEIAAPVEPSEQEEPEETDDE